MPEPPVKDGNLDANTFLAAERTLLAWVRTGLAMMGFGFVVARFGLFLHELALSQHRPYESSGVSVWAGTAMVLLGVFVTVAAAFNHWTTLTRLRRGEPLRVTPWSLGLMVSAILAAIGIFMASYLLFGFHF